jgi:hypothetical protein
MGMIAPGLRRKDVAVATAARIIVSANTLKSLATGNVQLWFFLYIMDFHLI